MLRRNTNYIIFSFVMDLALTLLSVAAALWLRDVVPLGNPLDPAVNASALFWEAGLLYPFVFILFSLYDPERTFRAVDEYQALTIACLMAGLALAGLVYFTEREISRLSFLYFFAINFVLLVNWRSIVRLVRRRENGNGSIAHRVLLVGGGESAQRALERLNALAWAEIKVVGYLTDGAPIPATHRGILRLGDLSQARMIVERLKVDDVLLALPAESYAKIQNVVAQLVDKPCNVWVIPDYFSVLLYSSKVDDLGGVPMISLKSPALDGYQRVIKRSFDLVVGSLLVLLTSPFMAIIALAIRLDSSDPVLFKQQRVGENGKLFWMYKFRSMCVDADQRRHEVLRRDENGAMIHKIPNDPRVTRVGSFIRKSSLDELPQLFNVLKGDMSLVGPRPELPFLVDQYELWQRKRFAVPQGITGWWQVNGRSDKPMHLHTEEDLYYIQNYSLLLDLQILLKTLLVVLRGKGAF